uniref:Uncharacterized protein n=1 Tax=Cucumis melo TaxID=3656 RepID=A0A9I9EK02_CUCME
MEDEEVQLVRKEKNPAVPPVLPIEFQEPLVSNDLLAKSFSVPNRKLRVNFAANKRLNAKTPNFF